ncbi:CDP-diacylglycerol--glycerol-3-phosphate 3-phosphatidyltransferase [Vulcanibacillus modesticaldus]|uniref:CDP-diacylglycerol--glycerol-3-phosphate 3-phosphatidyltransferase n=1 Tax=Vulcanibacillus modesticaldus TaxID=337097 RepID=A0A1D2YVQ5_9BACI|nr:CDP-diacylglycerol--glycerol-3-phosphate 3-phosphatidyltransferase [Vulcanibacillus modesticaldus]OEF99802.1 CDP-diacylglycerol--glycerol-3-phosphate 3-phosphatidyltransferase [Vulcanibacillus modesticaldus]
MNLPNILTISRFFLIPIFLFVFFFLEYEIVAFVVFLLAGLTDIVDGYIARKYDLVTEMGKLLDPLADKLMMLTAIISLLIVGKIPWFVAGLVFFREIGMIFSAIFFHVKGKKTVPANKLGKSTTVLFYIAILMITFQLPYDIEFLSFVVAFSFLTSMVYLIEVRRANKELEI